MTANTEGSGNERPAWKPKRVEYRVDASDVISYTGGDWAEVAMEGEAPSLRNAIGIHVVSSIEDDDLREIWRLILATARDRRAVQMFRMRCDAPSLRRTIEVALVPGSDGSITFTSLEVAVEPRDPVTLIGARTPRSTAPPLAVCSWCARARAGSEWLSLEATVSELQLFEQEIVPPLLHTICTPCADGILQKLREDTPPSP